MALGILSVALRKFMLKRFIKEIQAHKSGRNSMVLIKIVYLYAVEIMLVNTGLGATNQVWR